MSTAQINRPDMDSTPINLTVNGQPVAISADPGTPLLWALREQLNLTGTKYGCGVGVCGICTVHVDGLAAKACMLPIHSVAGSSVTTIEGLASSGHRVIEAWIAEQVPQCGYCQPGMVMAAAALLSRSPTPSDGAVDLAMSQVLCRCGSYPRVRKALHRAAAVGAPAAKPLGARPPAGNAPRHRLNPWVEIGRDNSVTIRVDRAEMGQGIVTGLTMLVAEELEVGLDQISTEFAPVDDAYTNPLFGDQSTGGSTSVRSSWDPLRLAGASARMMLVTAAAQRWRVPVQECVAERAIVRHLLSNKTATYGELASAAAQILPPAPVVPKDPSQFALIGTAAPRIEVPGHVRGETIFGIDAAPPGALVALVARKAHDGVGIGRYDTDAARRVRGVVAVVEVPAGIAVVGETFLSAQRGRDALAMRWNAASGPSSSAIASALDAGLVKSGRSARTAGDVAAALGRAGSVIEARYTTPFQAHGTMEPMNCTAHVARGRCEVWAPTQALGEARSAAAIVSGLRDRDVTVHATYMGGGFGRRMHSDFVAEAVQVAMAVDRPVRVLWTREDDMGHDFYRPANRTLMRGAIGADGMPTAWLQRVAGPGISFDGIHVHYAIPNLRIEHVAVDPGVPLGAWRAVGASQNSFAVECFIDELAAAAGRDPVEYRAALLTGTPRLGGVLALAASRAGWGTPPSPGRHRGIACYRSFGSYVAEVVEASVTDGRIKVHRVVCAVYCGSIVNPNIIAAQMEGAIIQGLGAAYKGEITFRDGAVEQRTFEDYPILKFAEAPVIEVHIVPSREAPGGVGEPGLPPVAPALANAVSAALGRRVRSLPIRL